MGKHKSSDYKLSAVKYYLSMDKPNLTKVCKIFDCKRTSLKRWITRYQNLNNVDNFLRPEGSYKITQAQVNYLVKLLKKNEEEIIRKIHLKFTKKFPKTKISRVHIGRIIRDNNKTRKKTTKSHFPKTYFGKERYFQKELNAYYKIIDKYNLNDIISLDETSIQANMSINFSRCTLGKRCVKKTDDNLVFKKYTLLVAISNSKCLGYILYKKGGMNAERLVDFLEKNIVNKYKNKLILLDNAGGHRKNIVKKSLQKNGNNYLYR